MFTRVERAVARSGWSFSSPASELASPLITASTADSNRATADRLSLTASAYSWPPPTFAKKIATGSVEYRAPILDIYRGPGTAPFFFDRVHAALFVDGGRTWGEGSDGKTRIGAGIEARLDMTLGYWLKIEPATGIAYGFGDDGEAPAYIVLRALSL